MKKIIIAVFAGLFAGCIMAAVPNSVGVNIALGSGSYTNAAQFVVGQILSIDALPVGNTGTTNTLTITRVSTISASQTSGGTAITMTNTLGTASIAQSTYTTLGSTNVQTAGMLSAGWYLLNGDIINVTGCGTNGGAVRINIITLP